MKPVVHSRLFRNKRVVLCVHDATAPATGVTNKTGFIGSDNEGCVNLGMEYSMIGFGDLKDLHLANMLKKGTTSR